MARTFIHVELVQGDEDASAPFWTAMQEAGFARTVKGRRSHRTLRLPSGMYVIDDITPVEALELTRGAARTAKVEARIFCLPVVGDVRFGNLMLDEPIAGEASEIVPAEA